MDNYVMLRVLVLWAIVSPDETVPHGRKRYFVRDISEVAKVVGSGEREVRAVLDEFKSEDIGRENEDSYGNPIVERGYVPVGFDLGRVIK